MHIKKIAMALIVAAGLGMNAASAAETYVGVNFGKSTAKDWFSEEEAADLFYTFTQGSYPTSGEVEDKDSAFKVYLGVSTSENIDFRLGYTNLGEATAEGSNGSSRLSVSVENQGVFADVLARFKPAERLSLYGKLGLAFMQTEMLISGQNPNIDVSLEGDSLVFVPGIGAAINITDKVALALEYERYLDVGDEEETGQSDVDVISAGISVSF